MKTAGTAAVRRRELLAFVIVVAIGFAASCGDRGAGAAASDEIRAHLQSIRAAIMAKDAAGIVRYGTADWRFVGPDGKTYDRAAYLTRTTALLAGIESIESLDTHVDRIEIAGDRADVELTQTMIRRDRAAPGAPPTRLWLRYREHHVWRRTVEGWRAESVAFLGAPERKPLPPD